MHVQNNNSAFCTNALREKRGVIRNRIHSRTNPNIHTKQHTREMYFLRQDSDETAAHTRHTYTIAHG